MIKGTDLLCCAREREIKEERQKDKRGEGRRGWRGLFRFSIISLEISVIFKPVSNFNVFF